MPEVTPRQRAIVPTSVTIPGVGQIMFPKALRGREVSESELRRLWDELVKPHIPIAPAPRTKAK